MAGAHTVGGSNKNRLDSEKYVWWSDAWHRPPGPTSNKWIFFLKKKKEKKSALARPSSKAHCSGWRGEFSKSASWSSEIASSILSMLPVSRNCASRASARLKSKPDRSGWEGGSRISASLDNGIASLMISKSCVWSNRIHDPKRAGEVVEASKSIRMRRRVKYEHFSIQYNRLVPLYIGRSTVFESVHWESYRISNTLKSKACEAYMKLLTNKLSLNPSSARLGAERRHGVMWCAAWPLHVFPSLLCFLPMHGFFWVLVNNVNILSYYYFSHWLIGLHVRLSSNSPSLREGQGFAFETKQCNTYGKKKSHCIWGPSNTARGTTAILCQHKIQT